MPQYPVVCTSCEIQADVFCSPDLIADVLCGGCGGRVERDWSRMEFSAQTVVTDDDWARSLEPGHRNSLIKNEKWMDANKGKVGSEYDVVPGRRITERPRSEGRYLVQEVGEKNGEK